MEQIYLSPDLFSSLRIALPYCGNKKANTMHCIYCIDGNGNKKEHFILSVQQTNKKAHKITAPMMRKILSIYLL